MSAPSGYRYRLIEKYAWEEAVKALESVTSLKFNMSNSVMCFTVDKQTYYVYNKITSPKYCIQSAPIDTIHCIVDNLATLNQPADFKGGVIRKVFLKIISEADLRSWNQTIIDVESLSNA
jgi:hypothetical protein